MIVQICADLSNDGARTVVYSSRGTKATHLFRASDGATLWTQKIPGQHQSLMAHDLNDDGTYEIIKSVDNHAKDDAHDAVYAFETDGELLWKVAGFSSEDSPNVADLSEDGQVEIVGMTFGSEVNCLDQFMIGDALRILGGYPPKPTCASVWPYLRCLLHAACSAGGR
ncbi:MAG: hypothetical protein ABGX16_10000 [Pirellulales bacterium]